MSKFLHWGKFQICKLNGYFIFGKTYQSSVQVQRNDLDTLYAFILPGNI